MSIPISLPNCGNTCFYNSLIQFLSTIPIITFKFKSQSDLVDILNYLQTNTSISPNTKINNKTFLQLTNKHSRQEDLTEWYGLLFLNILESFQFDITFDQLIIKDNKILSKEKIKINNLVLDLNNNKFIDLLKNFNNDIVSFNNIDNCIKKSFNFTFNEYISVILKRFNEKSKNNDIIDMPLKFNINNTSYQLISMSLHTGSLNGGHYVCYVNKNDIWYLCNDSNILIENNIKNVIGYGYTYLYRKM